ncbi:MAG: DUF4139 domain-containing protein [Allosphingosinicella sp.]
MRRALAALLALAAVPAITQPLVVSPRPDSVSVTVYRNPERGADDEMDLDWLEGFALITETRTLRLPAGDSVVRFEGVAGGIEPASAIVVGLPGGVGEKNRDARLISPGALVERALGRRVHIRRTNPKTGTITEEEGVIRSGPGGVILQTREGFEALRCSGLPEDIVFSGVPADLSATPTLAVTTGSPAASTVTVRLSYLARQFDWQANYIASLADDGKTLDLFAWLTLANGNDESFPDARAQAVAGSLNRDEDSDDDEPEAVVSPIEARCWPRGSTSDLPLILPPPPPPVAVVGQEEFSESGDIVVTGTRRPMPNLMSVVPVVAISAEQEELGDLKLYRIPEAVTVAAHAQKQVALLSRSKVPVERVYAVELRAGSDLNEIKPASILLRTKNVPAKKLGLPLPQGKVALFETAEGRPMLLAESAMAESAIGQEVEIGAGESADVSVVQWRAGHRCRNKDDEDDEDCDDDDDYDGPRTRHMVVQISNARPEPVTVEVAVPLYHPWNIENESREFVSKNGIRMWVAHVPANDRKRLTFVLRREPEERRRDDDD